MHISPNLVLVAAAMSVFARQLLQITLRIHVSNCTPAAAALDIQRIHTALDAKEPLLPEDCLSCLAIFQEFPYI
jgi:hypothetical protein